MADESSEASDHSESSPESDNQTEEVPKAQTMESKAKPAATHPKTSVMVDEAIEELAANGAMSLQAIKKFVSTKYGQISERQSKSINQYLKKAITEGSLVQSKGKTGITASFKKPSAAHLAAQRKAAKAAKESDSAKSTATKKSSKVTSSTKITSPSKKLASTKTGPKMSTADQKSKTTKATKATAKTAPKSPMAKKMTKSPTSKPKAPKPKSVTAATKHPNPAAKKAVAAKK